MGDKEMKKKCPNLQNNFHDGGGLASARRPVNNRQFSLKKSKTDGVFLAFVKAI
jgi:hypothetical protein